MNNALMPLLLIWIAPAILMIIPTELLWEWLNAEIDKDTETAHKKARLIVKCLVWPITTVVFVTIWVFRLFYHAFKKVEK